MVNIWLLYEEDSNQKVFLHTWGFKHYENDAPCMALPNTGDSNSGKTCVK